MGDYILEMLCRLALLLSARRGGRSSLKAVGGRTAQGSNPLQHSHDGGHGGSGSLR